MKFYGDFMTVAFFGHRDTPLAIEPKLKEIIVDLIENHSADNFLVGNNGNFDFLVRKILKQLKEKYRHINYAVVLSYLPVKKPEFDISDEYQTILFDGFEKSHPRYAIAKRNEWIVEKSDIVVTYVQHSIGGAAKYKELAEKRNKKVINIEV